MAGVYNIAGSDASVVKVFALDPVELNKWRTEVCVGKEMADKGHAPKVLRSMRCTRFGFVVLQRVQPLVTAFPDVLGHNYNVHLTNLPEAAQRAVIERLRAIVAAGIVHMDAHAHNVAFTSLEPEPVAVLFDWELAQRRGKMEDVDAAAALAYSLLQFGLFEETVPLLGGRLRGPFVDALVEELCVCKLVQRPDSQRKRLRDGGTTTKFLRDIAIPETGAAAVAGITLVQKAAGPSLHADLHAAAWCMMRLTKNNSRVRQQDPVLRVLYDFCRRVDDGKTWPHH